MTGQEYKGRFAPLEAFQSKAGDSYALLPLRFLSLDKPSCLLTNMVGEYLVLPREVVHDLIRHRLPMHTQQYDALKSKHFLFDGDSTVAIDLLAAKYRTKQSFLSQFTSLFMLVTTLRCDHSCTYCQVSSRSEQGGGYDMTGEVADKAVDLVFRSPSRCLKIEFQGGESLLNFQIVQRIVQQAQTRNLTEGRDLEFVIATNLTALTDEMLRFCADHNLFISTSLDGPRDLHNSNRPRPGHDGYEETVGGIRRVRETLGPHKISALMTTTRASLSRARDIVDEYLRQGFSSIFLRNLNPYGRAAPEYTIDEWLAFYRSVLSYIIELNIQGIVFREEFAALLLRKMLTPYATGFVDLQSPAGIGISGIVVNYDGNVYASDESRMLAEMGDDTFRLGNLKNDSYEDIMLSDALLGPLKETMTEGVPGCVDCALQPYCGSDPVRHYRTQGDAVGFKPSSEFCKKNMAVMLHLISLLESDARAAAVLRSWIR